MKVFYNTGIQNLTVKWKKKSENESQKIRVWKNVLKYLKKNINLDVYCQTGKPSNL